MHEKVDALPDVVPGLFGKAGDERNRTCDAQPLGGINDLVGAPGIEILVDDLLHSWGAYFDPIKDSLAAGLCHQFEELFIDAVCAGAAGPCKAFRRSDQSLAEGLHPFAIDGE